MLCYEIFGQVAWAWCRITYFMALLFRCSDPSMYCDETLRFFYGIILFLIMHLDLLLD